MWVPAPSAEIEAAVTRGDLVETSSFDAKVELPAAKRNSDLATDVAAMSTDGGALLYGVDSRSFLHIEQRASGNNGWAMAPLFARQQAMRSRERFIFVCSGSMMPS